MIENYCRCPECGECAAHSREPRYKQRIAELMDRAKQAEARCAALERDAARYRWLRDHGWNHEIPANTGSQREGAGPYIVLVLPGIENSRVALSGTAADAAIDSAIAKGEI